MANDADEVLCPKCGWRSCPFTKTTRKRTVSRCGGQNDQPYVAPPGFLGDIREKHHGDDDGYED